MSALILDGPWFCCGHRYSEYLGCAGLNDHGRSNGIQNISVMAYEEGQFSGDFPARAYVISQVFRGAIGQGA